MKKGWEKKPLGDICHFVRGPFGGSLKKSVFVEDGFAVYEQQHAIYDQFADIRYFIDHTKFNEMQRFEIKPRDLIMSCSGTMGKVAIVPKGARRGIINQALLKLTPSNAVSPQFLKFWMDSEDFQESLQEQSGGAAIQNVASVSVLKAIQIPLPPLPEQQRIVGILDEAFGGLATAQAHAAQNLQNARDLFESHLNAVFTQRGDGWVEKMLKEFVDDISTGPFGSLLHKSDYEVGGIPLVNPINIVDSRVVPDERKAVGNATAERLARYALQKDDIVIGRRGEIGRCAVISDSETGWLCGTGSFFIRPSYQTDPHFLAHLLRSQHYRKQLEQLSERATMPSISNSDLANLVIAVPSVNCQKKILSLLDTLTAETQRLTRIYEQKMVALAELKKSLLHQAFNGEL